MILTEYLPPRPHQLWQLAAQMGIRRAIVNAKPERTGLKPVWEIDTLRQLQREFAAAGLQIYGLEGDQFDMRRIKLGLEGRDEDIKCYCQMLRNMGELGIPLLCYNFMAQIGWWRSKDDVQGRGGALLSRFDLKEMPAALTEAGEVPARWIWENYRTFIQRVMPVAEKAGVRMALHPDDPPLPSLRGVGRIFGTIESFEKAYALAPSPSNGVTFCRANFKLMGADLRDCVRRLTNQRRLFFLHLRDVHGTAECFEEVFHDEAATALKETLQDCHAAGFGGPVRCDHVPTLAGEPNDQPGYGTLGRLFADGYIMGLMDALGIPRQ
ncbi:MAG TPA: mannonate dehydratase [Verrucomicrobiae bacterium]